MFTRPLITRYLRHEVLVTTKTGPSFRGVLWEQDDRFFVLRDCQLIASDGRATPADGEVLIRCPDIDYVQVL